MCIYIQLSSRNSNSPNSNIRLIATNIIFPMSNCSPISKNFLLIDELKLLYQQYILANRRTKFALLARIFCSHIIAHVYELRNKLECFGCFSNNT